MKGIFNRLKERIAKLEYEQTMKETREKERRVRIENKLVAIRDNSVKVFSLSVEREQCS